MVWFKNLLIWLVLALKRNRGNKGEYFYLDLVINEENSLI